MKYKVVKLDGRYSHSSDFRYLIKFSKNISADTSVRDYDQAMRWFNDHFGWTQEVETRLAMIRNWMHHRTAYSSEDFNPIWSYCAKYSNYRIYVLSEKELEWFLLSNPQS